MRTLRGPDAAAATAVAFAESLFAIAGLLLLFAESLSAIAGLLDCCLERLDLCLGT